MLRTFVYFHSRSFETPVDTTSLQRAGINTFEYYLLFCSHCFSVIAMIESVRYVLSVGWGDMSSLNILTYNTAVSMYSRMPSAHAYSLGMYDAIRSLVLSTGLQLARARLRVCSFSGWLDSFDSCSKHYLIVGHSRIRREPSLLLILFSRTLCSLLFPASRMKWETVVIFSLRESFISGEL